MATEESTVFAIAADDPDQFSELLLPVTPELDISAVGRSFRADAQLAPLEHISLFLPRVNQGRVRKEAVEDCHSLNVPLNEPLGCRIDGRYRIVEPGHAYLAGPGNEVDLRTGSNAATLVVNLAVDFMDSRWLRTEHRNAVTHDAPRVFSLASPSGRRLFSTVSATWGELLGTALPTRRKLDLEAALADALARTFLPAEERSPGAIKNGRQILERAKGYVSAHLGDHVAIPDIAWAAGTSNRTLHRVFLHEEGLTPIEFVTQERLNAARRALFAADREGITVTNIAFAHGFNNLGRFSLQYQNTFGERPSVTPRR